MGQWNFTYLQRPPERHERIERAARRSYLGDARLRCDRHLLRYEVCLGVAMTIAALRCRELLILAIYLLVTFAKLLGPGGVRAVTSPRASGEQAGQSRDSQLSARRWNGPSVTTNTGVLQSFCASKVS